MNILETDHWCLLLPIEWRADYEDDVVRISDADGVGEIEVSTRARTAERFCQPNWRPWRGRNPGDCRLAGRRTCPFCRCHRRVCWGGNPRTGGSGGVM